MCMSVTAGPEERYIYKQKRLPASAFSKKMVEKRRKELNAPVKCKECVEKEAISEREAAAKKREAQTASASTTGTELAADELHECSACKQQLPVSKFSRAQLTQKGPGKQRCAACLNASDQSERALVEEKKQAALKEAQQNYKRLVATGAPIAEQLAAASLEAAAEAELVTGLKPVRLGSGRGRGGRRGGYAGRGRGTGKGAKGA
ncbi:hypothetical protein CYMTET_12351 [Cymbomonas tetramitiformis]|uniref:Stc1 domain-containing protein n=1 Tax=Cymbomonas tetramitiformis TaxID=36881 RepID=A0AAE0GK96_9CHLO|nr:hypothetical protein CYMTET_12351 [Cymbomonas tetramitiformis]